jgi:hypothetical protein
MNPDFPEDFAPEDIADIEAAFARVYNEERMGYRMEFFLDDETANEVVREWAEARKGDLRAIMSCWSRYAYIVNEISDAVTAFGSDD